MAIYDYIIVGAGAAGCVLANRLSENPEHQVALIEAGGPDSHPFIHMPKGLAKIMANPAYLWTYQTNPEDANARTSEPWVRGRVLGGSTAVNGMMYVRGMPQDFDSIADLSNDDWSWKHIGAAYAALESHELGSANTRGNNGPLNVTMPVLKDALANAMLLTGQNLGWSFKEDVNEPDDVERIGYAPRTIYRGRRESAATAFLNPVRSRKNLHILTHRLCDKVIFDGNRACAVQVLNDGKTETIECHREIILAGGALASPGILERSGVGNRARLEKLGISSIVNNPEVGENLIEHRALIIQWKLNKDVSQNKSFSGWRAIASGIQYYLTRGGPLAAAAYELGAWFKTQPEMDRTDAQFLLAPFSFDFDKQRQDVERHPGMHITTYPLRPGSKGHVHINSTDPNSLPELCSNYHDTEQDRAVMIGIVRKAREFAKQEPIASYIEAETMPGPEYDSDEKIIEAYDRFGTCGYHAVGSCRMGKDENSVVDPALRVRGTENLRVMDTSVMPVIPSGNTNGPTMAMAWRAADIILRDS